MLHPFSLYHFFSATIIYSRIQTVAVEEVETKSSRLNILATCPLPSDSSDSLREDLRTLEVKHDLDVWSRVELLQARVVSEEQKVALEDFAKKHELRLEFQDLEGLLKQAESLVSAQRAKTRTGSLDSAMTWDNYYSVEEIYAWLDTLPGKFPDLITVETIGTSHEGREIKLATITNKSVSEKKTGAIFTCLFHAREWLSGAFCTYVINELTANAPKYGKELKEWTFYIVPVTSPDGYAYTLTDRLWRKNRRPVNGSNCVGVDLNRNFADHFGGDGSSSDPCSEVYKGPSSCSENECQALVKFFNAHKDILDYYSIHTYGQMILTPWSYVKVKAFNDNETEALMRAANAAIYKVAGNKFRFGSSGFVYDTLGGVSEDWVFAQGVNYSYCFELRGGSGGSGFLLPPAEILPGVQETWAGIHSAIQRKTDYIKANDEDNEDVSRSFVHCCHPLISTYTLLYLTWATNWLCNL